MPLRVIHRLLGPFSRHLERPVTGFAVDSRKLRPGDLFFALPGAVSDGHTYLQDILAVGAAGAVIRADYTGPLPTHLPVVRVENPLRALQQLAQERVREVGAKVVAVTGSIGKTTTKEFIHTLLSVEHRVTETAENYNSQIGMSLSLMNSIKGDEEWLVVEMGMSNESEIRRLIDIVPPDIAVITMVALVHMENFNTLADIARAKAEIFESHRTTWNLYNADTSHADVLSSSGHGRKRTFSTKGDPSAFWTLDVSDGSVILHEGGEEITLPCPLFPARHIYENMLAAIAVARTAGMEWEAIEEALPLLRLPKRRLEKKRYQGIWFINDSYNAAEPSMVSALEVLSGHAPSRRIAVLGQMRELKNFSEECHRRVGQKALGTADSLYCLGSECGPMIDVWKGAGRSCFWTTSLDELTERLHKDLQNGDVVLLKGSRSNELWKVVDSFMEGSNR